jgi:hypothetical protein
VDTNSGDPLFRVKLIPNAWALQPCKHRHDYFSELARLA